MIAARLQQFTEYRPTLIAAAYRITGSAADAEDVVQDAWQKWADVTDEVQNPRAYLSVLVSRLALNQVRLQSRRRETYAGPWLPEPIVDRQTPEWEVLHRDGLGHALDAVLSSLTPEQATAFVLRKVLGVDYHAIADVLQVSQPAARQLVSRARRAISAAVGDESPVQRHTRHTRALEALKTAIIGGDLDDVIRLLAPDSVIYSDGGGKATAAIQPVRGADRVARFLVGIATNFEGSIELVTINGAPGLLVSVDGSVITTLTIATGPAGLSALYFMRNPDKLARI